MATVEPTTLPLGSKAPEFALSDPDGRVWTSSEVAGPHGTLIVFACNHCPYVKHVGPTLGEAAERWNDAGVGVIAINSNDSSRHPEDSPAEMPGRARGWGWTFPYVVDADQTAARAYGAVCTPDFFLFDSAGTLVYRGRLDGASPGNSVPVTGEELDAAVAALVAGEPISTDQRPSVGCSIKWKPGNEPSG